MKRFLSFLVLVTLAACARAPAPGDGALLSLAPSFGGAAYDNAWGLAKHTTGVYAVGETSSDLHRTLQGYSDAFIRKYTANGSVAWGRQFGLASQDGAYGVASDANDNAYVVGYSYNEAQQPTPDNAFIRKYTAAGGLAWARQFGTSSSDSAAGVATYGSVVYVVGSTRGNLAGTHAGDFDAFIRKYNANGSVAWTRQFGTSDTDFGQDVAVDGVGNAYVVARTFGSLDGTNIGDDMFLIRKYTASGSVAWTREFDYREAAVPTAVAVAGSSVYLVGYFYADDEQANDAQVQVFKLNTSGSVLWSRTLGNPGNDKALDVTADSSGVTLAGSTEGDFAAPNLGGNDGFVYKLSPNGRFLWAKGIGTAEHDGIHAVQVRGSNEVYAAGSTDGTLGGPPSGGGDAFLRRLNATNGTTVWTR